MACHHGIKAACECQCVLIGRRSRWPGGRKRRGEGGSSTSDEDREEDEFKGQKQRA